MKTNYKVYPKVKKGKNFKIESFSIVGLLPKNKLDNYKTIIGDNAYLRSHSVIYAGNIIGDNFFCGHNVVIRESNIIGNDVSIGTSSVVEHHCQISDKVRIHSQAFICEYSVLEESCWIGPNVVLTNTLHPLCPMAKKCLRGPIIKKNAKIGANVTILPEVVIGENSLIGAGSVVAGDIPKNSVAVGNPATVIKNIYNLKCKNNLIERPYEVIQITKKG